ncbi:MAG: hypothetical protein AMXMBFR84_31010 [Candidatus Hydrogenedentota bacterium]
MKRKDPVIEPNTTLEILAIVPGVTEPMRKHIQRTRETLEPADPDANRRLTQLGTPCSPAWDDAWMAQVDAREQTIARRICGARTPSGLPCEFEPNHENGRCRFHGGFKFTGAPKANRNAVVHGLHTRRLMTCGPHCPVWQSCPCAGKDVEDMPPKNRPLCPFELAEYNAFVTDGMALVERRGGANPFDRHTVHTLAMLQVIMSRATAMLGLSGLTPASESGDKPGAAVQTLLKLMAEYRRVRDLLPPDGYKPTSHSAVNHVLRMEVDTNLTPEAQEALSLPHDPETPLVEAKLVTTPGHSFIPGWQSVIALHVPPKTPRRKKENVLIPDDPPEENS